MAQIKLKDFYLEKYQSYNDVHNMVINTLNSEKYSQKYLGDLKYLITKINQRYAENYIDSLYITYKNDSPIGFITLVLRKEKYEVDIGILPNERQKHYAKLLTEEFVQKAFELYPNIDKIYLQIDVDNSVSQTIANKMGYIKEQNNCYYKTR